MVDLGYEFIRNMHTFLYYIQNPIRALTNSTICNHFSCLFLEIFYSVMSVITYHLKKIYKSKLKFTDKNFSFGNLSNNFLTILNFWPYPSQILKNFT